MKVLVYIETKEGKPMQASLEAITAAEMLGEVELVKVAEACQDATIASLESYIKETQPDAVVMGATQFGKDIAPRLAQRFNTGCITDVTAIEVKDGAVEYSRPAYGGTIIEKLAFEAGKMNVITTKGGSFAKKDAADVKELAAAGDDAIKAKVLETVKEITEAVNLEGADIVVAGGRGCSDAEGFKLVEDLAAALGAVVGASRPAIEEGWVSRAHQVGQSGKTIAPKLYIACGISGAMQHISSVTGSKYIVAINKDADASIFNIADLGIVGDLKVIVPMLTEQIKAKKG